MEKALLIGIITQEQPEEVATESINELEFLTLTAGAKTKKKILQKLVKQNSKTFIGKGKIYEVKEIIDSEIISLFQSKSIRLTRLSCKEEFVRQVMFSCRFS